MAYIRLLQQMTAAPGWDGPRSKPVPAERWRTVIVIVDRVRANTSAPEPGISVDAGGAVHLRWSNAQYGFDLEIDDNGYSWSPSVGLPFVEGSPRIDEALKDLQRMFPKGAAMTYWVLKNVETARYYVGEKKGWYGPNRRDAFRFESPKDAWHTCNWPTEMVVKVLRFKYVVGDAKRITIQLQAIRKNAKRRKKRS